jgi:hypothetical protein
VSRDEGASSAGVLWPAVDLGGTTIRVMLLAADSINQPRLVVQTRRPTIRGLDPLLSQISDALTEATAAAAADGWYTAPVLAIGTPGRIKRRPDGSRVIAPRSATNLEAEPGELEGVDLAAKLSEALSIPVDRIFWENDAVVQGRYLIAELLAEAATAEQILGRNLVCINPGTGLGGCVAAVADDGTVEVFTDSHISELGVHPVFLTRQVGTLTLMVSSTASAAAIELTAACGAKQGSHSLGSPAGKQAEDFIAGSGVALIAHGLAALAAEVSHGTDLFASGTSDPTSVDGALVSDLLAAGAPSSASVQAARFMADLGGVALARLITGLHRGELNKTPGFPDWSQRDLVRLCGVDRFVLGGGITKTPLGQQMIAHARDLLKSQVEDAVLFEMDELADEAGAIGAFFLIPDAARAELA